MTPIDLLILSLFSWRLAYMLVKESGPWDVFAKIRTRVTFGGMLNCIMCTSVWTALIGYIVLQSPYAPLVYVLAASGAALWGHKYVGWAYDG